MIGSGWINPRTHYASKRNILIVIHVLGANNTEQPSFKFCFRESHYRLFYNGRKETYMRGEMSTWSDITFDLYYKWFRAISEQDRNLPEMTSENIAILYGYRSLSDVEERLQNR